MTLHSELKTEAKVEMTGRVSWLDKVLKPDPDKIAASFGWLEKFLKPEADPAERRLVDQFAAYRWNGSGLTQEMVRDISSTGLYLITGERWQPGTILTLTLQREGPLDMDPARRITTQVKVMRCGTKGVGLSFLWSKDDPKSRRWEALLEGLLEHAKPGNMERLVRMVEAFAFLNRLSSDDAEAIGAWVRGRASSLKIQNAASIVLKAENLLRSNSARTSLRVNPAVAVRILEVGSSTEEDWLQGFWAGLLITAGSTDAAAERNLELVELFSQLTSIPIRIFTVICTRATKVLSESGHVCAQPLACDLEELTTTVGSRGAQTDRDLASLAALQLIEREAANAPALLRNNHTYITPTSLGLQLFALCNGHRGSLRDFYLLDSIEAVPARPR